MMSEGFKNWEPLLDLSMARLPGKRGECSAAYAMRDASTGEILKFGHAGCLRTRIIGNYLAGLGGGTSQRIHRELIYNNLIDRVEVSWAETKDSAEAEQKEKQFRANYKTTHGRRPMWDRLD